MKVTSKIIALFLSVLMLFSGMPYTSIALAEETDAITDFTALSSDIDVEQNGLTVEVKADKKVKYDGSAIIPLVITYAGEQEVTDVVLPDGSTKDKLNPATETTKLSAEISAKLDTVGDNSFTVSWVYETEQDGEPVSAVDSQEYTITIGDEDLTEDSFCVVTYKAGSNAKDITYYAGETYEAHKDEALAVIPEADPTFEYSYTHDWNAVVEEGEIVAAASRKTFDISDVDLDVKLLGDTEGNIDLGTTASAELTDSSADGTPTVTVENIDADSLSVDLDTAYCFKANDDADSVEASAYKDYLADFVVTVDTDLPAGAIEMWGKYDASLGSNTGEWTKLDYDEPIVAGKEYHLLQMSGYWPITYSDVAGIIKKFYCGAKNVNATGATMEVALKLYKTESSAPVIVDSRIYTFGSTAPAKSNGDAYVGGVTNFKLSLDNDLYKIYSVSSDTSDTVNYNDGVATATFTSTPKKLTVYVVIDENAVKLKIDEDTHPTHFINVDETLNIDLTRELPVELTYTINDAAAVKGDNAVKSDKADVEVKGVYAYGDTGEKLELTEKVTFEALTFAYETDPADVTPKNVGGSLYFQADSVKVKSGAAIEIKDADGETVEGEEAGSEYVYTLGQGAYTSAAFGEAVQKIFVDNVAPTVALDDENLADGSAYEYNMFNKAEQKVWFTVSDAVLGTASVTVKNSNGDAVECPEDSDGRYYFVADKNDTYTITTTDIVLGNHKDTNVEVKANDETLPTITAPAAATEATNAEQKLVFAVSDTQSGVNFSKVEVEPAAEFEYSEEDGTITLTVTENGTYTVTIQDKAGSQDTEGNSKVSATYTVDNYDNAAPSASMNLPDDSPSNWFEQALETIKNFFYKVTGTTPPEDDAVSVTLKLEDIKAANENDTFSGIKKAYYCVYLIDPEKDITSEGAVNIAASNFDAVKAAMEKTAAGETASDYDIKPYADPCEPTFTYGENVVFVYAEDLAGNILFAYSDGIVIDDVAPTITAKYKKKDIANGAEFNVSNTGDLVVSVQDTPNTEGGFVAGINSISVTINGDVKDNSVKKELSSESFPIELPAKDGTYAVTITATDMCNNTTELIFTYRLDTSKPELSELTYGGGDKWSQSSDVSFTIKDTYLDENGDEQTVPQEEIGDVDYSIISKVDYDAVKTKKKDASEFAYNKQAKYTSSEDGEHGYCLDTADVVDGEYIMYVAFRFKDCADYDVYEVREVSIQKDTVSPVITEETVYTNVPSITVGDETIYGKFTPIYTVDDSNTVTTSGVKDFTASVKVNDNAAKEKKDEVNGKTSKTYKYNITEGQFCDEEGKFGGDSFNPDVVISDDTKYEVVLNANDVAKNAAAPFEATYHVDAQAPTVDKFTNNITDMAADGVAYTNNNATVTFDVTDANFFQNGQIGNITVTYLYNGVEKNAFIEGATFSAQPTEDIPSALAYESGKVTFTATANGLYEIQRVSVTDLLNNETVVEAEDMKGEDDKAMVTSFVIDTHVQSVDAITFTNATDSLKARFRAFAHGVYSKDAVEITVVLSDAKDGQDFPFYNSETKKQQKADLQKENITLYLNGKPIDERKTLEPTIDDGNCTWKAVFYIECNQSGRLSIQYTDDASNSLDENPVAVNNANFPSAVKFENKDVENNFFLSENTDPVIDILPDVDDDADANAIAEGIKAATETPVNTYVNEAGEIWVNNDVSIPVSIEDVGDLRSGLYSVTIKVNNEKYTDAIITPDKAANGAWSVNNGQYVFNLSGDNAEEVDGNPVLNNIQWLFTIDTSKCDIKDGKYYIEIEAEDYATNKAKKKTLTVFKDVETAYVTDFKFSPITDETKNPDVTVIELSDNEKAATYGARYGYYCREATNVTVTASDKNSDQSAVSGVKTIYFRAVDFGTKSSPELIVYEDRTPSIDESGIATATFELPANFKGQVYAYAEDNVGNKYDTDLMPDNNKHFFPVAFDGVNQENCVVPEKTVLETGTQHAKETHIQFSSLPATDYKDAAGHPLYNKQIAVKVTVTDTYSGIRSGKVSISSLENRADEKSEYPFTFDNNGLAGDEESKAWTIDKVENNLVTQISRTIIIKRDSNNITMAAEMEDRAGNTSSEKQETFSIDKTAPTVVINYDNNAATESKYFKANRTATITVTERNFDASRMNFKVNGSRINLSWSPKESNYKEGQVFTARYTFDRDGDYKVAFDGTDRANNNASVSFRGTAPQDFTIDKTAPRVRVDYECAVQPMNGNYYRAVRTAIITVDEHNFNPDKFKLMYRQNTNGATQYPVSAGSWSNSGDRHVLRVPWDSLTGMMFTLDYELMDRAENPAIFTNNNSTNYTPDVFYVDRTAPALEFTGQANDTTTRAKELTSDVTATDTYFWHIDITIEGARSDVIHNYSEQTTNSTFNIAQIIEAFANDDKHKDDRYTIKAVATDKAGNSTELSRVFTINRNGSFFVLNDKAQALVDGKFCNDASRLNGIAITEYNVDPIKNVKLVLTKGNEVITLKGDDYSVNSTYQNGFYINTYTIHPEVFADDAKYSLQITSEDAAGNKNKSSVEKAIMPSHEDQGMPVLEFTHDETRPEIDINLNIKKKNSDGYSIAQNKFTVRFKPVDYGSGIDATSVVISIDGKTLQPSDVITDKDGYYYIDGDGYYVFTIDGVNKNVSFQYKDMAGNEFENLVFKKITVSSNPLVRWFNNTPLFIGTLVGIALLAFLIILLAKRRKKDDDEEEEGAAQE